MCLTFFVKACITIIHALILHLHCKLNSKADETN
nr:MAG TPA: hypothetical protein [Caudoviricetes sp.]